MIPFKIEHDFERRAWVTWGITAACVAMFALQDGTIFGKGDIGDGHFMLWPGEHFGLWQLVTSGFMHGDLFHLGFNLLFLWVFGRYAEDRLGHVVYAIGYSLALIAAAAAYAAWDSDGVPCLGASGAVAGTMGMVLLLAPTGKVSVLFIWFSLIRVLQLPAWFMLGYWALGEFFGLAGPSDGVAYIQHVVGFVIGACIGTILRTGVLARAMPRYAQWLAPNAHLDPDDRRRKSNMEIELLALRARASRGGAGTPRVFDISAPTPNQPPKPYDGVPRR